MAQKVVPNIWFNKNADEAGAFYADALPKTTTSVSASYPDVVEDWQAEFAGTTLTVDIVVDGYLLVLINAGDNFRPNPSVSFMLNFDPLMFGGADGARAALDATWHKLADGGRIMMALESYPFSTHYGWVEDRYGVSWQLILTDPAGEPRPFVIPQLMFNGAVQDKAREATTFYASIIDDSAVGFIAEYEQATGPASVGSVMFGEFTLAGQWFSMMDSAVEMADTAFSCGVSLEVRCADQTELDTYWNALTAVPEAEVCGWLADKYGLSWQIVPANLGELMDRPGAYEKLMKMSKIVIAEF